MLYKNCGFFFNSRDNQTCVFDAPAPQSCFLPQHILLSDIRIGQMPPLLSSPNASLSLPLPPSLCSSSLLGSWSARSCRAVPVHPFRTKCVCDSLSTFAILARVNLDSVSPPSPHDVFSLRHSWLFLLWGGGETAHRARCGLFSSPLLSPPRCLRAFQPLFPFSSYFHLISNGITRQRVDAQKQLCVFKRQKQIAAH